MSAVPQAYDARAVDDPVQPCPLLHDFGIHLVPADPPTCWPQQGRNPYGGEAMTLTLAGAAAAQQLDDSGMCVALRVPGGSATVHFEQFYAAIEADLDAMRQYPG